MASLGLRLAKIIVQTFWTQHLCLRWTLMSCGVMVNFHEKYPSPKTPPYLSYTPTPPPPLPPMDQQQG